MNTQAAKETLAKIEKQLGKIVGRVEKRMLTPDEFVKHAYGEIQKAANEPFAKSQLRLQLLYKSVMYSSDIIENTEADNIKVPVFVADQTTLDEQSNELSTPSDAAGLNPSGQTVFENGFNAAAAKKMLEDLQTDIDALKKKSEDMEEGDDTTKAAKPAKPPPAPPQPPGKKSPPFAGAAKPFGKEDDDESDDDEKKKSKAQKRVELEKRAVDAGWSVAKEEWSTAEVNDFPDSSFLFVESGGTKDEDGKTTPRDLRHFPVKDGSGKPDLPHVRNALARIPQASVPEPAKAKATAQAQRMLSQLNKSLGGDVWPEDMNDPEFIKKGTPTESEWGDD